MWWDQPIVAFINYFYVGRMAARQTIYWYSELITF